MVGLVDKPEGLLYAAARAMTRMTCVAILGLWRSGVCGCLTSAVMAAMDNSLLFEFNHDERLSTKSRLLV
jgi:hypothetical protein